MNISDEAVEAAARAMSPAAWGPQVWQFAAHGETPTAARNRVQKESLEAARNAIEAAAPYLARAAGNWCVVCDHLAYNPGLPATVPHTGGDDCAFEDDDWNAVDQ